MYCAPRAAEEGKVDVLEKMGARREGCFKAPTYREASGQPVFLNPPPHAAREGASHALRRKCATEGCVRVSTHGEQNSSTGKMCAVHATEGMSEVAVVHGCVVRGCLDIALYGMKGSRSTPPEYCPPHATEGMVNVVSKRCVRKDCPKRAYFAAAGGRRAEFCAIHAGRGAVDLYQKICARFGCSKHPCFGMAGTKRAIFCSPHALEGMVNVVNTRCAREGCSKQATHGAAGSKKRLLCTEHSTDGMVSLVNKRCEHDGCTTQAFFGVEGGGDGGGGKRAKFCSRHAGEGMVNVVKRKCALEGCSKNPSYGVLGAKRALFCSPHAPAGMVNVVNKVCLYEGCRKYPSFGVKGTKDRRFCNQHAAAGMVNVSQKALSGTGRLRPARRDDNVEGGSKPGTFSVLRAKTTAADDPSERRCSRRDCYRAAVRDGVNGSGNQRWLCRLHGSEERSAQATLGGYKGFSKKAAVATTVAVDGGGIKPGVYCDSRAAWQGETGVEFVEKYRESDYIQRVTAHSSPKPFHYEGKRTGNAALPSPPLPPPSPPASLTGSKAERPFKRSRVTLPPFAPVLAADDVALVAPFMGFRKRRIG